MNRNFERSLSLVLEHEGGYVNHPKDPGGATNLGVTIGTARRLGIDVDGDGDTDILDIKLLKPTDAAKVYRAEYWNAVKANDLPGGVDYAMFDYAVNSGPGRAAKHLQAIVGVPQDGEIGPVTLAAVANANPIEIINRLCDKRLAFLQSLPTWATFGKGWGKRVASVRAEALKMAADKPSTGHNGPVVTEPSPAPLPNTQRPPIQPPGWAVVACIIAFLMVASAAFFFGR